VADQRGALRRVFSDVRRAGADDGTSASAGGQFRESHSYRHNDAPCSKASMRTGKSQANNRLPHLAMATNAKDFLRRKRVNHEVALKWPLKALLGSFRPIAEQRRRAGERIVSIGDCGFMVNAPPAPRFARRATVHLGPPHRLETAASVAAGMSLAKLSTGIFSAVI
jgi:hypothetical protein